MAPKSWQSLAREEMNPRLARRVLHTANLSVARIELARGAVVPLHSHHNEQITMLESGRLRFLLNGSEIVLKAGEMLEIPPEAAHEIEALEDSVAIDIFAPRREDWIRGDDAYLRNPPR